MSEALLVALIVSIPPTVVTLIVGILNSKKTEKIHVLVNSNLSSVKAEVETLKSEIVRLKRKLGE